MSSFTAKDDMVSTSTLRVCFTVFVTSYTLHLVTLAQVKFIDVCDVQIANRGLGSGNGGDSTERGGRDSQVIGLGSKDGEDGLMLSC